MALTVALIEDSADIQATMLSILKAARIAQCVGAFSSGEEALLEIPKLKPKVVLMDISLTGMDGVECVPNSPRSLGLPQILIAHRFTKTGFHI